MENTKYVQTLTKYLAGAGTIVGATSVTLTDLTDIYGNVLTMADFGVKGYITLEPNTTNEESATFTGITANVNGTYTLTGVSSGLAQSPYTETGGLVRQHSGGTQVVITDTVQFWNTFPNKNNDSTIAATYTFTSPNYPRIDSVVTPPVDDEEFVTKKYVDDIIISGAPDASNSTKGITKLSVAAVTPTDPIAVGDNDPRVPTQDENDALAGTSGTPSSTNKYVTNDDTTGTGPIIRSSSLLAIQNFGDGSDSSVTFDGSTTILGLVPSSSIYSLTRDIFCTDITIDIGVTIKTQGYKIFATGTITNNGTIDRSGIVGGNGGNGGDITNGNGNGTAGTAGVGVALSAGTVAGAIAGQNGQIGQAGSTGSPSTNTYAGPVTQTNSMTGIQGTQAGVGGTGGGSLVTSAVTAPAAVTKSVYANTLFLSQLLFNPTGFYNTAGQSGGGAAGNSGAINTSPAGNGGGGGGGAGGGAGGILPIYAKTLVNSATGVIQANGGDGGTGGNGGNATPGGGGHSRNQGGGGGGGGAGGSGGVVIIVSTSITNNGTIQASGGALGTSGSGGTGDTNGANGANGNAGNSGLILQFTV